MGSWSEVHVDESCYVEEVLNSSLTAHLSSLVFTRDFMVSWIKFVEYTASIRSKITNIQF